MKMIAKVLPLLSSMFPTFKVFENLSRPPRPDLRRIVTTTCPGSTISHAERRRRTKTKKAAKRARARNRRR